MATNVSFFPGTNATIAYTFDEVLKKLETLDAPKMYMTQSHGEITVWGVYTDVQLGRMLQVHIDPVLCALEVLGAICAANNGRA